MHFHKHPYWALKHLSVDQYCVFLLLTNPFLPFCTDVYICSKLELVGWESSLFFLCLLVLRKSACETLQGNLSPCVRSQLKPRTLFKGFTQDRGVAVHCSQQKGRFLLFPLSLHNHSRLTEGISYTFWKSDEHWWYLSGNFSWSQIFVKLQLPRLKAEPKLAGAWLRNSIYFIWFETI